MHKVEHEILNVTETPPKVLEENREEYLKRLAYAVNELDDAEWENTLSEEAKIWFNNTAELIMEGKELEDFYEFFGTTEGDAEAEELPPDEARERVENEKRRQSDKRFSHPYKGTTKRKPGRKPTKKAKGSARRAKELFLEQPDLEIDELLAELVREGHTMSRSTLISVRAEFRNSLKVLADKGYLNTKDYYFGFPIDED